MALEAFGGNSMFILSLKKRIKRPQVFNVNRFNLLGPLQFRIAQRILVFCLNLYSVDNTFLYPPFKFYTKYLIATNGFYNSTEWKTSLFLATRCRPLH